MPRPKKTYETHLVTQTLEERKTSRERIQTGIEAIDADLAAERLRRIAAIKEDERAFRASGIRVALSLGVPGYVLRKALGLTTWADWNRELGNVTDS